LIELGDATALTWGAFGAGIGIVFGLVPGIILRGGRVDRLKAVTSRLEDRVRIDHNEGVALDLEAAETRIEIFDAFGAAVAVRIGLAGDPPAAGRWSSSVFHGTAEGL